VSRLAQEKDPELLRKAVVLLENHNRALTKKIAEVLRELLEVRAELAALKGESVDKQLRLEALQLDLAKLTKLTFGPSSEQRPSDDKPAEKAPEGDDKSKDDKSKDDKSKDDKKKRPGHGPTEQPALLRIEVDHELDEADKTCPQCGGGLREMDGQYEEHDEIDVVPMRFVFKHHRRKKYSCQCGGCIETALGPDKLVAGGRYSINFAIYVAISKYCDHLPLERQVRMMARDGLVVTSQTLWDQIEQLVWVIESVMPRLRGHILGQGVIGADETSWELMGNVPGQAKSWWVWVLRTDDAIYYAIRGSRGAKTAKELLVGFAGVLMCDGYDAYISLARQHPLVVLAHCWAHVRREFLDIEKSFPTACKEILELIGKLYFIEKPCPTGPEGDEARRRLRNTDSRAVIDAIVEWFYRTLPKCLPESGLHKAIGYMVHMWTGLVLFLDDPRIPLDNNASERAARGPVLGRKNHYGSRSLRGTEIAATLYSLVESAKLNGLEPRLYLRVAVHAGLRHETVPLPHEVKAMLAAGTLTPADYDDYTEGIVNTALAEASHTTPSRPPPPQGASAQIPAPKTTA
jgi:transposase